MSLDLLVCMLSITKKKKPRHNIHEIAPTLTLARYSHQEEQSLICNKVLYTHLTKNYVAVKDNLDN
jgi:hypothetical protein